jgi:hypothetical protein
MPSKPRGSNDTELIELSMFSLHRTDKIKNINQ